MSGFPYNGINGVKHYKPDTERTNFSYITGTNTTVLYGMLQYKGITKLTNFIKEKVFDGKATSEFKKTVSKITAIYYFLKSVFYDEKRDDGTRYFEHLRNVAYIASDLVLNSSYLGEAALVPVIETALWHDGMEDKNISFDTIKDHSGLEVAIAVEALSKKSWQDYDNNKEEGKKLRNEEYFEHYRNYEAVYNEVKKIANEKYKLNLTAKVLNRIAYMVIFVKLADRIHNLSTQWDPNNIEKVKRKVKETEEYFLKIAKEISNEAYNQINTHLSDLKDKLKKE